MRIGIVKSTNAYTPEAYAYERELTFRQMSPELIEDEGWAPNNSRDFDLIIRFAGFIGRPLSLKVPEIHDYASLSTGRLPRLKNFLKSRFSSPPVGRVFLNDTVRIGFEFSDTVPFVLREMGVDEKFFWCRGSTNKDFDVVYCGSISGRPGLLSCIEQLCRAGIKFGLAGKATQEEIKQILKINGVYYVGPLAYTEVPNFLARGRYGLNFCPDVYPLNIQTSTKVLEYLAAGLGVISNNYEWINEHSRRYSYKYIGLHEIRSADDLDCMWPVEVSLDVAKEFDWRYILDKCNFAEFVRRLAR